MELKQIFKTIRSMKDGQKIKIQRVTPSEFIIHDKLNFVDIIRINLPSNTVDFPEDKITELNNNECIIIKRDPDGFILSEVFRLKVA